MTQNPVNELELEITPTLKEFQTASLIASRRIGTLRPLVVIIVISVVLLFTGFTSLNWFRSTFESIVFPVVLCISCPLLLAIFFVIEPRNVKNRAKKEYKSLEKIMKDSKITLGLDQIVINTPMFTSNQPYALMHSLVETPEMFVIIRDRERILVLPKRCFDKDSEYDINEFLRNEFARKRYTMRGWIF